MKPISLIAVCVFVSIIEAKTFLFPIPQQVDWSGTTVYLSRPFRFENLQNVDLENAANRYWQMITRERWTPVQVATDNPTVVATQNELRGIHFQVSDNKAPLDYAIDESYTLSIPRNGGLATLTASTWVGALRALETFSQLIESDDNGDLVIHTATITDAPTYPHRGILLDTSRNYYPVTDILRILEAQSFNKMNVLHWHATDSQSWPLVFTSHPELSEKGAYSSNEIYTPEDVRQVIAFAKERGIRVIIEIDMPAHTASIGESHPDYIICANAFWANYAAEPPAGQLNPFSKNAVKLVKDVIKEATERFPDSFYHIGGDEITASCWELNNDIKMYTKKYRMATKEIWFEWTNKLLNFVKTSTNKRAIMWEDPVKDGGRFPKDTVVQTWLTPPSTYTALGHDVIVSNYDYFYLDCGKGGWIGNDERYISPKQSETAKDTFNYGGSGGSWCSPFKTWQRIYTYDLTFGVNKSHKGKIIGGEVAMWSEQTGPTVVDGRLWPRSAAAAELYWSGSYDKRGNRRTLKQVSERFYDWVYRLQARGIDAEPAQPKYCAKHPGACNLNEH